MIELLIIWLITIIISYGLKLVNELKIFKSMADFGYKIDMKELFSLNTKISKKSIITNLSMLMPLYNIVTTLEKTIQYNNFKYKMLEQSGLIDVIRRMTDEEKKKYLEKPTGLNAAHIALEENKVLPVQVEKNEENMCTIKNNSLREKLIHKKEELQKLKQKLLFQNSNLEPVEINQKRLRLTQKPKREKFIK